MPMKQAQSEQSRVVRDKIRMVVASMRREVDVEVDAPESLGANSLAPQGYEMGFWSAC